MTIERAKRLIEEASEDLYAAIEALEKGDLVFARSNSQHAASLIIEAYQVDRSIASTIANEIKRVKPIKALLKITSKSKNEIVDPKQ